MCRGVVVQQEHQELELSMQPHTVPSAAASQLWWPWLSMALHHQPLQPDLAMQGCASPAPPVPTKVDGFRNLIPLWQLAVV